MAKQELEFDDIFFETDGDTQSKDKYSSLPYVIVRTESAGVFAGYLRAKKGAEVRLLNARRIWYWEGAATLSQLAMGGSTCPDKCKFPPEMGEVVLLGVSEIIKTTRVAKEKIEATWIWQAE